MVKEWEADIERILLTEGQIRQRVQELAAEISRDFAGKHPLLVGVLTGAVVFLSDLIRLLTIPYEVDFISASSYDTEAVSSGSVRLLKDLSINPEGRHLLVVEDIVDTGLTLQRMMEILRSRGPSSVKVCVLLDKKPRRVVPLTLDYVGFEVPDEFLVGYGLDYARRYRGLPFVAVLKRSVYGG